MRSGVVPPVRLLLIGLASVLIVGCQSRAPEFTGGLAYQHVLAQCAFGPRPVGSEENEKTAEYIEEQLRGSGWTTQFQEFEYRGVLVRNVIGAKGHGPLVLVGAHFDTRSLADRDPFDATRPVLGANDGASGVAVLLELARTLDVNATGCEIWLAFFDAEDQGGINEWPFSVGAQYMADNLTTLPRYVVIVDMVGDSDQAFFWEQNSDDALLRQLWAVAAELGYQQYFVPQYRYAIIDDHIPFRERGIPAADIIDFDYPYWHTAQDTPDKVSADSLERVGRVLKRWLEQGIQ